MTRRNQRRFQLDRRIPRVGRFTNRAPNAEVRKEWNALLSKLRDTGRLELLRQLKAGYITFRELIDADRRDALHYATDSLVLARALWASVGLDANTGQVMEGGWLTQSADATATRTRYAVAARALWRTGVLGPTAEVRDLAAVDWAGLKRRAFADHPVAWMHIRRTVSAFLTGVLRRKTHPFRQDVMAVIPSSELPAPRVPDLTIERFWEILDHVPEPLRPCYVTMAAGGLGPGEYLRAQEEHLLPLTLGLRVVGTKQGRRGEVTVRFDEGLWDYVRRAIPAPVGYSVLRETWRRACKAVGQTDDRLYDLRHCTAQWAVEAGEPEARVQGLMRHKSAVMTRHYARTRDKGETARALGQAMLGRRPA